MARQLDRIAAGPPPIDSHDHVLEHAFVFLSVLFRSGLVP
jgi:hypothetical protein